MHDRITALIERLKDEDSRVNQESYNRRPDKFDRSRAVYRNGGKAAAYANTVCADEHETMHDLDDAGELEE